MNVSQSSGTRISSGTKIIGILVVVLLVLHQDNWFWTDDTLIWGFMPIGMFWHVCISVGAGLTWLLAAKIAWPADDPLVGTTREVVGGNDVPGGEAQEK